jgi:hypothetical protein
VPYPLDLTDEGVPILPPNDNKSLDEVKQIVRSFLTLNYRRFAIWFRDIVMLSAANVGHAAANKHVPVPWAKVCKDTDKFFDDIYFPAGVELREISKMKADALQTCYAHWYKRQEQGERAFMFKSVDAADKRVPEQKRKRQAETGDSDEEDGVQEPKDHEDRRK